MSALSGCVGEGAAVEFNTWVQSLDLIDPEILLANPKKFRLPDRGDKAHAQLSSILSAVLSENTPERWEKGWILFAKAADKYPDVATVVSRDLAVNAPTTTIDPPAEANVFYDILKEAGLVQ